MPKTYSLAEVSNHDSATDCWLAINGKVYNMTKYVSRHPGGHMILMGAGRDATALFESHHPLKVTQNEALLKKFYVGDVAGWDPKLNYELQSRYYVTLKERVERYFAKSNMSPRDSPHMWLKTLFVLSLWSLSYYGTFFGFPSSMLWSVASAVVFGLSIGLVGMCIMHDGNHGGYSDHPLINRVAGFTMDMVGGSSFVWRQIHQIGHHVHTNVDGLDPDIHTAEPVHFRRIKDSQKWWPHYALQHVYLVVLYSSLTFELYFRDFFALVKKYYNGVRFQPMPLDEMALFWLAKAAYPLLNFMVPILFSNHSLRQILTLMALSMAVGSYVLVTMFQVNHVVEQATFYRKGQDPRFDAVPGMDWACMQTEGSSNFAPGSVWWNFWSGGLNHQIEHHLFPAVCHVHYPALAPIVRDTAREFGISYNSYPGFASALRGHWQLLMEKGIHRPKFD